MNKKDIIKIAKENNGYINRDIVCDNDISTIYLSRLCYDNKLKRIDRGVYYLDEGIEDYFYVYSSKYKNIVYSGTSALYLNKLSNMQFEKYEVTVPYNSAIPKIQNCIIHRTRKNTFNLGIEEIETPYGNKVKCYNKERCICDLFINEDAYDKEDRKYAIKEYFNNYCKMDILLNYAKKLNVYEKIKNVIEVIK